MRILDLAITLGFLITSGFQAGSPWPKLQGNALNNGNGTGGGSNGVLCWSVPIPINSGSSSAIAANNTIYLAATGSLLAVNPIDGSTIWSYPTGCLPGTQSSPVIGSDGTIYATGSGAPLLLAISPNGKQNWQFSGLADGGVYQPTGAPTIGSDGTIYFAAEEFVSSTGAGVNQNYLFALNQDGSVKWSYKAGQANVVASSPTIGADGTLYIGTFGQNSSAISGSIAALNPMNGNLEWSIGTTGQIVSSPAVGPDGTVYAGEQGGTKNLYAVTPDGTAKILFTGNGSIVSTPAVASDSSLYFPESDGSYYALTPNGEVKWSLPAGTCTAEATVIGSDGTIYYGTRDGHVVAAFQQGTLIWSWPGSAAVASSLSIAENGAMYFGGSGGNLNALGTEIDTIPVSGIALTPSTVVGGQITTATVTIQSAAPKGGALVHLQTDNPSISLPLFTIVAPGATQTSLFIGTKAATDGLTATITASAGGASANAALTVLGATLTGFTISPSPVVAPVGSTGTVALSAPAPTGGITVQLTSASGQIGFPPTVTIPGGSQSATFSISTAAVLATTVCTIRATQGSATLAASLTISPPSPTGLTVSPTTVLGGASTTGTVTLSGQAATSGQPVLLSSSSPSAIVPSSVTVAPRASSATFSISTVAVASSTTAGITASIGSASAHANLTIDATSIASLTLNPTSVAGGSNVAGIVSTTAPAPLAGFTVGLTSSMPTAAKVPALLMIARGKSSAQFTVQTSKVPAQTIVSIEAALNGSSQSRSLTIDPPALSQLSISPSSVLGGKTSTGTVGIQSSAPTGGVTVRLVSENPAATVPTSVTIGSGKKSATFPILTTGVAIKTSVTITGTEGSTSKSVTLTITPAVLQSIVLSPSRVKGGSRTAGTVTISGLAPSGGAVVRLSSNKPAAQVPQSVTVPSGQTKATFTVVTSTVTAQTTVTVAATLGSTTKSSSVTVTK